MNIALALIIDDSKILIGKVKHEKLGEYGDLPYVFPCEHVQDRESAEKELIQEVKVQTNLDVRVVHKIGERIHPSTKNYTFYFHCETKSEDALIFGEDTDFEKFSWININEIKSYMPTLFDEVAKYLEKKTV
jgi:ADP-ribose pyrophosphatase YjhB (NUDIX family)